MFIKIIIFAILELLISFNIHAQSTDFSSNFTKESFSLGATSLAYRKAVINSNESEKPSIVLYLHGGTSRGDDNEAQLNEVAVETIFQYLSKKGMYAIMIVPQCPAGGGWTSQLRRTVNELLKHLIVSESADADRIYILGGSMGGTGTWTQLSFFPGFYAAAMPVAGNPSGLDAANVATTPVLTVMGTADRIMSISAVEDFQSQVLKAGGTLILEKETGWTHEATCEQSYTEERLNWLFSHARGEESAIRYAHDTEPDPEILYDLWGRVVVTPKHGIYFSNGRKIVR